MEKQGRLRNRRGLLLILSMYLVACQPLATAPPAVFVSADQPGWKQQGGQLWLNKVLFSGWQYQLQAQGDTAFAGAFVNGKAEGIHRHWYANGQLKEIRQFRQGWQEGEQRGWHESGKLAFVYRFKSDVYEGRRQEWYPDGHPARDGYYRAGQEDGAQQMWFPDGSLKANYVTRQGRNYGFTGVKNCVSTRDSLPAAR